MLKKKSCFSSTQNVLITVRVNFHKSFNIQNKRKSAKQVFLTPVPKNKEARAKFYIKVKVLVAQLCLTLGDPMACSLPSSSVHGILQARILEWEAIPFSSGPCWLREWTQVSCIAGCVSHQESHKFHCLPYARFSSWSLEEATMDV